MATLLNIEDLSAGYGARPILHEVTLSLRPGERVLLVGPNGSGKSTLLKTIVGLLKPSRGQIVFDERDLRGWDTRQRIEAGMGYLAQTRNVFLNLTVLENLRISCFRDSEASFQRQVQRMLALFPDLERQLNRRSGLLSGGQRQALAVSMVLAKRSQLFLFDEPTAGLSPAAASEVLRGLLAVQQDTNFSALIVEHNVRLLTTWADRAIIMSQGRIVAEERNVAQLLSEERLARHYF